MGKQTERDCVTGRTIKLIPGAEILEIRYAGAVGYEFRIETLEAIETLLARDSVRGLLINYTSAWPAAQRNPRAVSEFGLRLGRLRFKTGTRIALVNAPSAVGTQTIAVGTPAGLHIRLFYDREQAVAWLDE